MTSESRNFKVHPNLLFDVIPRQAGSLGKAVLEGVMNAVDAGATEIVVTLGPSRLEIADKGRGFRDKGEIERFFEVFGQPHEPGERKTFGTFRMGRGQLFAFGQNTWRTNRFEMVVDIKKRGLDYDLTETPNLRAGCCVSVLLDNLLNQYEQRVIEDEIKKAVRWLSVPVILNGTQVSTDPGSVKWDLTTPEAYMKFTESGDLTVYNLGVLVRDYGGYQFGCGGTVVSRQQLRLNFARNDVMSDCPVWKEIKAAVNKSADKKIRKKKSLSDNERHRLIQQFRDKELEPAEATMLPLFTDVAGKHWSLDRLVRKSGHFRKIMTHAATGDVRADKLMQLGLAFVLDRGVLDRFGAKVAADLNQLIKEYFPDWPYRYESYARLVARLDDTHQLLPEEEWRPLERAMLKTIGSVQPLVVDAVAYRPACRRILLGQAGGALAWTDGSTHITFCRDFLKSAGNSLAGLIQIGQVLIHELCHDEPNDVTHVHSPEFYEHYHDSRVALPLFVTEALRRLPSFLRSEDRRATRKQLAEADRLARLGEATKRLS